MFEDIVFPTSSSVLFDKVLTLGWYDGITSGLANNPAKSYACRFDLLIWSPRQDRRIFALSRLNEADFSKASSLVSKIESPKWPRWVLRWPSNEREAKSLDDDLKLVLIQASKPDFVLESDSMFEEIFAVKPLSAPASELLADRFDGEPYLDNYEYWHQYLYEYWHQYLELKA